MFGSSQRNVQSENMNDSSGIINIDEKDGYAYRSWDVKHVTSGSRFRVILKNKQSQMVYKGDVIIEIYNRNNKRENHRTFPNVSLENLANGYCSGKVYEGIKRFIKPKFPSRGNDSDLYTHYMCSALCILVNANSGYYMEPFANNSAAGILVNNSSFIAQYN